MLGKYWIQTSPYALSLCAWSMLTVPVPSVPAPFFNSVQLFFVNLSCYVILFVKYVSRSAPYIISQGTGQGFLELSQCHNCSKTQN